MKRPTRTPTSVRRRDVITKRIVIPMRMAITATPVLNSEDDGSDYGTADEDMDEYFGSDSGYNSNRTDVTITDDRNKPYMAEIDECGEPLGQKLEAAKPSGFKEVNPTPPLSLNLCLF